MPLTPVPGIGGGGPDGVELEFVIGSGGGSEPSGPSRFSVEPNGGGGSENSDPIGV